MLQLRGYRSVCLRAAAAPVFDKQNESLSVMSPARRNAIVVHACVNSERVLRSLVKRTMFSIAIPGRRGRNAARGISHRAHP